MKVVPETRPAALVQDKYAIALRHNDITVGHVPKFLSKLTYFYLKYGGTLTATVSGERRYSLKQGGIELPADFKFCSTNSELQEQMGKMVGDAITKLEQRRKQAMKKKEKKKNCNFLYCEKCLEKIDISSNF